MNTAVLLTLCVLVGYVLADAGEVFVSSDETGELDSLTAVTLETFGDLFDDDEIEEENNSTEDAAERTLSEADQVVHAAFTEDGMIAVEDMIFTPEMFEVFFPPVLDHEGNTDSQSMHRRAAIASRSRLWPKGRIAYAYHSNLHGSQAKVRAAMDEWERHTCVKFEYRKPSETAHVQIRTKMDENGKPVHACATVVGYTRRLQYLNLAKNCFNQKTLLHELGHTLGLIHEHQHPNRDKYITIIWDNVNPSKKNNYDLSSRTSSWGIAYDPMSIMHYKRTGLRKKGCKEPCYTMESKLGPSVTNLMGTATQLSKKSDIPIVNKMYCAN